jgi:acyl carrier protein
MNLKKTDIEFSSLRDRVIQTIVRILGKDYDARQLKLELNSLKMLELIVALEEEFDIHISEDAPLSRITSSVDAIMGYLRTIIRP